MSFEKIVKLACKPKAAPPKAKYLDPIIAATYSDDGAVSDVCRALSTRLREPNATVVYKGLIVLHTMIRTGNTENVLGYLAQTDPLRLQNIASGHWEGYSAPENLGAYANYLQSRINAFRELKHDAVRVQSESNRDHRLTLMDGDREWGGNGGVSRSKTIVGRKLRVMTVGKGLLRETKIVQGVVDDLVNTKFYVDNLEEELNVLALRMLVKDLLVLFQAVNEGVINILERYFEMSHIDAEAALGLYRQFCKQTERVVEYLSVAKKLQNLLNVSIPNLKHAPVSLVNSLEGYLNDPNFEENRLEREANKTAADGKPAQRQKTRAVSPSGGPVSKEPEASTSASTRTTTKETKPQSVADFFSSIEQEQSTMFNPTTNSPTANYFQQQASVNPFTQRQSILLPQQTGAIAFQAQATGFPGPSPFLQPQVPGVNPASAFIAPQQQPQQNTFLSPQPRVQPQTTGFLQPQPATFLQPQPQTTGFNPFRQSMLLPQTTGLPSFGTSPPPMGNYNPFPRPGSASPFVPGPSRLPTLQELPTSTGATGIGATNAFSASPFQSQNMSSAFGGSIQRPASTPIKSSNAPMAGIVSHQTGSGKNSRNPFGNPVPPPPPVPALPKAPTLKELAAGVVSTASPGSGIPLRPTSPGGDGAFRPVLRTQPTGNGLIGGVASSFVSGSGPKSPAPTSNPPFASFPRQNQNSLTTPRPTASSASSSAFGGNSALFSSSAFGTISGGSASSSPPSALPSITPLQSQPTGFAGSSVRPFKPSSTFGASLVDKLPTIQSEPTTPAITGAPPGPELGNGRYDASAPPPAPGMPSLAGLSVSLSPGALNSGTNPNQHPSQTSSPLLATSSMLGSSNGGLGGGLSTLGGGGLRPQPTGGAANPFRISMMFGGGGMPGGGANTPTPGFGGAFGANFPNSASTPSGTGAGGSNTAFATGTFATQSGGSAFPGGWNNHQQQSLI